MRIPTRLTPADLDGEPLPSGRLSRQAFDTGEIELRYYAPPRVDEQLPHRRDELYFVARGSGTFEHQGERVAFAAGDVLFAAAGEPHRFLDFSSDFATWVVFYGPEK